MSNVVIIGCPYDGGAFRRKGAKEGPSAIRSHYHRIRNSFIETGATLALSLNSMDIGDIEIDPYNNDTSLDNIYDAILDVINKSLTPICLGGDHSITISILRALTQKYLKEELAVIHIDAHTDTFSAINGYRFHHGAVFRTLIEDGYLLEENVFQFGIRGTMSEMAIKSNPLDAITTVTYRDWKNNCFNVFDYIPKSIKYCYLSLDIDVVDPAFAPGTGTPVPGGMLSSEILEVTRSLGGLKFIGMDIVECSPAYDVENITSLLAAYILANLIAHCEFVS